MNADFLGETLSYDLLDKIRETGSDVCGENGEYHTFVYDGPIFCNPVYFMVEKVEERSFTFKLLDGSSVSSKFYVNRFEI